MGDLLQASKKAWGAVAHYLKSVAKYRGWQNRTHRDLTDIAFDLAYENRQPWIESTICTTLRAACTQIFMRIPFRISWFRTA